MTARGVATQINDVGRDRSATGRTNEVVQGFRFAVTKAFRPSGGWSPLGFFGHGGCSCRQKQQSATSQAQIAKVIASSGLCRLLRSDEADLVALHLLL